MLLWEVHTSNLECFKSFYLERCLIALILCFCVSDYLSLEHFGFMLRATDKEFVKLLHVICEIADVFKLTYMYLIR